MKGVVESISIFADEEGFVQPCVFNEQELTEQSVDCEFEKMSVKPFEIGINAAPDGLY